MSGLHQRNTGPMQAAARCGAKTRSGGSCQAPSIAGKARCRMHGGKGSGAPKDNRNALKKGLHTAPMRSRRKQVRELLRQAELLISELRLLECARMHAGAPHKFDRPAD